MMHDNIKAMFSSAVSSVTQNISEYVYHPGKNFVRERKLPADRLIRFFVAEGSSSTKNEMIDFGGASPDQPGISALNQQRAKLRPEALEAVFNRFNSEAASLYQPSSYHFIAADGSTATYFSTPVFSSPEYFVEPGHSAKGFYSIHINALYDLDRNTYTDALLQPVHEKDEFRAFCAMVDRQSVPEGSHNVYIGDRGYCSYNNMAHVAEAGQYFLFRTKDIHSKGLNADSNPINVTALLQRELIPVRDERKYPRLKTAHFRKPRYFIYRAS